MRNSVHLSKNASMSCPRTKSRIQDGCTVSRGAPRPCSFGHPDPEVTYAAWCGSLAEARTLRWPEKEGCKAGSLGKGLMWDSDEFTFEATFNLRASPHHQNREDWARNVSLSSGVFLPGMAPCCQGWEGRPLSLPPPSPPWSLSAGEQEQGKEWLNSPFLSLATNPSCASGRAEISH